MTLIDKMHDLLDQTFLGAPVYDPELPRTFPAVVEASSFTAAGKRLGLSQLTVSQQIRRLEPQVGRALFRSRHTQGHADRGQ